MPVAAALGAAALGAGGSILAAKSQKKAANKATDVAAQTAAANNALQREIYGQNRDNLSPFMQRGDAAGGALNALLGLDGATASTAGFDQFRASTGYDFRLGEGQKSVLAGLGNSGFLDSGAAQKALVRYGQNFGSNEFGNYANLLQGQQQIGLSGASALAGVSTNYAGAVGANNDSAASVAANNALYKGSVSANMYGGIASSLGSAFGQLGSSYGGTSSNQGIYNSSPALQGRFGLPSGNPWGVYSTPPIAG